MNRALSKANYRIHTDAVKENLIPPKFTPEQIAYTYASEADLLNVALFGQTAKQWKNNNLGKKGNVRDDANLNQLLVLANMESYNAIITTIQKLSTFIKKNAKDHPAFDKQIVIIFDECHRSQFGDMHAAIVDSFNNNY